MCSQACGPTPDKEGTNVFILIKGVNKVFSNQFWDSWASGRAVWSQALGNQKLEGKYEGEDVRGHLPNLLSTEVAGDLFQKT